MAVMAPPPLALQKLFALAAAQHSPSLCCIMKLEKYPHVLAWNMLAADKMSLMRLWGSVWLQLSTLMASRVACSAGVAGRGALSFAARSFCLSIFRSMSRTSCVRMTYRSFSYPNLQGQTAFWHATPDAVHEAHTQCQCSTLAV